MSPPRFFAPDAGLTADDVELPPDEAEHLARVLRLRVGAQVRVFDGRGHEWLARIETAGKRRATVELGQAVTPKEEPHVSITLAPAILKGDSLDQVIRDATTLGVVKVQPVIAARSEVTRTLRSNATRLERWRRVAVAAAKQCGRAVVPAIEPPESFAACLGRQPARPQHMAIMTVEPDAAVAADSPAILSLSAYQKKRAARPDAVTMLVGPEGGWTSDELRQAAASGCDLVTLGRRTFRADATPLVALALFQFLWGDF